MKILHTADWHLGKNLHGASLIEEQKHALQQIIEIAQAEDVDAIIIAGDLYDKPIPTIEATELLEATLYTLNVEMELPVLARPATSFLASHFFSYTSIFVVVNTSVQGVPYYPVNFAGHFHRYYPGTVCIAECVHKSKHPFCFPLPHHLTCAG